MARLQATNNARTTLDGDISSSDTTINVADASVFPSTPFMITVGNHTNNMEIMKVIDVDSNALTVERARENTNPVSHNDGVVVQNNFTAGTYTELASDFDAHKAETMSKVLTITEPSTQTTDTTIDLGFKPKSIHVNGIIHGEILETIGFVDEEGNQFSTAVIHTGNKYVFENRALEFSEGSDKYVRGHVSILSNGIKISWTVSGNVSFSNKDRRYNILALTHGEGDD